MLTIDVNKVCESITTSGFKSYYKTGPKLANYGNNKHYGNNKNCGNNKNSYLEFDSEPRTNECSMLVSKPWPSGVNMILGESHYQELKMSGEKRALSGETIATSNREISIVGVDWCIFPYHEIGTRRRGGEGGKAMSS